MLNAAGSVGFPSAHGYELHLHSLVDAFAAMAWTARPDGSIDYVNQFALEYLGAEPDELLGAGWLSVIHPEDRASVMESWQSSTASGKPYDLECRIRCQAAQSFRWHLVRARPLLDAHGTVIQWLGTCMDIDDQRRAYETQRRNAEQLQFIVEAADRLSQTLDTPELVTTLSDLIVPRFADWMALHIVDAEGRLQNVALAHVDPTKAPIVAQLGGKYYLDPAGGGGVTHAMRTKAPFLASTVSVEMASSAVFPVYYPFVEALGLGPAIFVPLLVRGHVTGALSVFWSQSGKTYNEVDVPFFEELAKRVAVAFDDAKRHDNARANEELTRQILASSKDCISILDPSGRILSINKSARLRYEQARVEQGRYISEDEESWLDYWTSEDRPRVAEALARTAEGTSSAFQGCWPSFGLPTWWDVVLTPMRDTDGRIFRVLAISRDISRRKIDEAALRASEERHRSLVNAMPQIAFTARLDGSLDYVNQRWLDYSGLTASQSLSRSLLATIPPEDRSSLLRRWASCVRCGDAFEAELRLRRADGSYRWHLVRAVPLHDTDQRLLQWFGTGTDIDDQKRAAAEITLARDNALRATRMKSQFVATMSHEIRTPMNGLIGMTELLLHTRLDAQQREYANVIIESGQSLLRLINDILDFSKIEAGKLSLERARFSLRGQIDAVFELLGSQFGKKNIALDAHVDEDVDDAVVGDAGRLRQILMNLLGNALKFTDEGGRVSVSAGAATSKSGEPQVHIAITDTGIGIPEDVRRRLFRPFEQGDGSTTRRYEGTGLGLSICKELLALMDGSIGVESMPGIGSTFWFRIPHQLEAGRSSGEHARPIDVSPALSLKVRPEKILLVEDNHVNRVLATKQFEHLGFRITSVPDGRAAYEIVQDQSFDLVFMDCHMPGLDGYEATRAIRGWESSRSGRLPIIAMTADARDDDRRACLDAGMDDYLSKPVSLAALSGILARWLPRDDAAMA